MRSAIIILIPLLCFIGAQEAMAGDPQWKRLDRYCIDGHRYGWSDRRAMRHLFPGRMQLTLGKSHRRHFMHHCQTKPRWHHHRSVPSWSRWHDPHGRFAGHFYGFNDVYGPRGPHLRPRYGTRSLHLRFEFSPRRENPQIRAHPRHAQNAAHLAWCEKKYRSFRASDNTFQPYHGPRRRCRSPYRR